MTDEELLGMASAARSSAYAPYSGFAVGAAVLAGGRTAVGANVENASYGLCLCAERIAIARAVLEGARRIEAIAVCTSSSPPAMPCGMCLQTIAEFATDAEELRVIAGNTAGEQRVMSLRELLPHAFSPTSLGQPSAGARSSS
ncbi:MAG: cytidine deaminase [Pseudomonadota bacterium]